MVSNNKIVYFAGAIRGNKLTQDEIKEALKQIQKSGAILLTEHIGAEKIVDQNMTAEAIESRDIGWLNTATHVIAEISGPSTGTGREIEYARLKHNFGHPRAKILCIYRKDYECFASPMIRGMTHDKYPNIIVAAYFDKSELAGLISNFLS